jgi:hypothetical protein
MISPCHVSAPRGRVKQGHASTKSSISSFARAISNLENSCGIAVSPHHCTINVTEYLVDGNVVLFWHESLGWGDERALMRFSVEGPTSALSARAVGTYDGLENGLGQWGCSKDRKDKSCLHIHRAKKFLSAVLGSDLLDTDHNDPEPVQDAEGSESLG